MDVYLVNECTQLGGGALLGVITTDCKSTSIIYVLWLHQPVYCMGVIEVEVTCMSLYVALFQ